jgi:hypothetical protein
MTLAIRQRFTTVGGLGVYSANYAFSQFYDLCVHRSLYKGRVRVGFFIFERFSVEVPKHRVEVPKHRVEVPKHRVEVPKHRVEVPKHRVEVPALLL